MQVGSINADLCEMMLISSMNLKILFRVGPITKVSPSFLDIGRGGAQFNCQQANEKQPHTQKFKVDVRFPCGRVLQ